MVAHMIPHIRSGLFVFSALAATAWMSSAAADDVAAPPATQKAPQSLDLRAPDIKDVISLAELERIIAASYNNENIEEVEVEGDRVIEATPRVWPGIFAPFWALANPAQAWRIFAPLPPDQANSLQYTRSDATDSYILEPAGRPIEQDVFHP